MSKAFILILQLLIVTGLFAQVNTNKKPFIIKGKIENCTDRYMSIAFLDANDQPLIDTIPIDKEGKFYHKTFKVLKPQRTDIRLSKYGLNYLFVAPGYDLTITANGKDRQSFSKTTKIEGIGSESNRYRYLVDSITRNREPQKKHWLDMNEEELLSHIRQNKKLHDSVAKVVFNKPAVQDKYLKHFGNVVQLDNAFNDLEKLLIFITSQGYTYDRNLSFVKDHFDNKILDDIYNEHFLISEEYKQGLISSYWLDYLLLLDHKKDTTLRNSKHYELTKLTGVYKGKVREYALFNRLEYATEFSKTMDELNHVLEQYETFGWVLQGSKYKTVLENKLIEKKHELLRMQTGKPAPAFALQDISGTTYKLEDFKNKVVYLDLWASWCTPCKQELPHLKNLYDKYKNDDRLAIVSIAVRDRYDDWMKIIGKGKHTWIQLFDKDGVVTKTYFANALPQFIVIDKQGKIVNFNAPWPSSGKEIIELLDIEMAK